MKKFLKKLFGLKSYKYVYLKDINYSSYNKETGKTIKNFSFPVYAKVCVETGDYVEIFCKAYQNGIKFIYSLDEYKRSGRLVEFSREEIEAHA